MQVNYCFGGFAIDIDRAAIKRDHSVRPSLQEENHEARNTVTARNKEPVSSAAASVPEDWAQLLRKLRWAGLEEEARNLEVAVGRLPADERGAVNFGPFSTD